MHANTYFFCRKIASKKKVLVTIPGAGSDGDDDFWSSSSEDEDEDEDEETAGLNGAMPDDGARPDDGDWTPPPPTTSQAPSSAAVPTTHSAATTPSKTQPGKTSFSPCSLLKVIPTYLHISKLRGIQFLYAITTNP